MRKASSQRLRASLHGAEGLMLRAGPTSGHPMGLIHRPINALLMNIASRMGKMKNAEGQNGLGLSMHLAFRSSKRPNVVRQERKRAGVTEFSSRQSEAKAAPAALFHNMPALFHFSSERSGGSRGKGLPIRTPSSTLFTLAKRATLT